jgi:hypothetical protein
MPAHLLEGHFQLPTHHEPAEDLLRSGVEFGTQEELGFEPAFGITGLGKRSPLRRGLPI